MDSRVAAQLTRRLKEEGFLTRSRIPWLVKTAAQVATRLRVYGDPFTSVRNKVGQLRVHLRPLTDADNTSMKYPKTLQLQRFKLKTSTLDVNAGKSGKIEARLLCQCHTKLGKGFILCSICYCLSVRLCTFVFKKSCIAILAVRIDDQNQNQNPLTNDNAIITRLYILLLCSYTLITLVGH